MIWNSTAAMTAIDLAVVVSVTFVMLLLLRRPRKAGVSVPIWPGRGYGLILIGLLCTALFYFADLVVMHGLPLLIDGDAARAIMTALHLDVRWLVTLVSIGLICTGLLLEVSGSDRIRSSLAASEARYRSIVQSQREFIVRWQPGGVRTWVNDSYRRFFGFEPDEVVGTSFFPLIAESDRQRIERELARLSPARPERTGIHGVTLSDGRTGWQEWTDRAFFDDDGKLIEIQSVGRDVTARVRAERALAASESRYRDIVEHTVDWVWEINRQGRHTYSNQRVEDILGYSVSELVQFSLDELIHPDEVESVLARLQTLQEEKQGWREWVVRFRHKDGGYRYLESAANPVFDDAGHVKGYRGIDRDVSFATLMDQVTAGFVGRTADAFRAGLVNLLQGIGFCYGLDRMSFWKTLRNEDAGRAFEWARPGMQGPSKQIRTSQVLPEALDRLTRGENFAVGQLRDLNSGSAERKFLEAQGVKSTLSIPVRIEDRLVGAAVFSTVERERGWPEAVQNDLRVLAERILTAYLQAEANETILRQRRDLEQSESLASIGSYTFYATPSSGDFPERWDISYSDVTCALFEVEPHEASYEVLLQRLHPDDKRMVVGAIGELLESRDEIELQFRIVDSGGNTLHLISKTHAERDPRGRVFRIVGACRDVTDQLLHEESLKAAYDEIAQLKDRIEEENVRLRQEIRSIRGFEQIVGESESLRSSLSLAARAAPTDASILILGETGTGKDLLARAIHELSDRSSQRLVSLNCAAIPAELVESELFGHERGAFTGAHKRRIGRFELADRGTLFLDEVAELPPSLQGKLLRVLQDGEFERVGGTETIRVDVRLISATNRDLRIDAAERGFRADLFYRINTITIELPPLRDRKGDIPLLVQHFSRKHGPRIGKTVESVSRRFLEHMESREWPGNVRELEHFIESALITTPDSVLMLGQGFTPEPGSVEVSQLNAAAPSAGLKDVERDHIVRVLQSTGWKVGGHQGAAAILGLPPSTLRSRMKRLGIERD